MEISKKEAKYLLSVSKAFNDLLDEVPLKLARKIISELTRVNMTTFEWEELEKRLKECINGSNEIRK